jgi:nucleoside-diphosphate-sugar epimerase
MSGKILITGASGFVGKNLISYLKKEAIEIATFTRKDLETPGQERLANVKAVIHLAGKAHDLRKASDPNVYFEVNYELTKKLYNDFLQSKATIFIYVSSVKAVADSVIGSLTENHIPHPKTAYGKSKLMAEQYIMNQVQPVDKSFFILRPCMIHGPGNKGNLNLLYRLVRTGIPYPLAAFDNKRSFLSVENLCFVINELIKGNKIPSGIYNVADDDSFSTSEVVSILAFSLNKRAKLWKISPTIIRIFAKIGDRIHLPLTTERLNKLIESYVVDNNKIKNVIGKNFPVSATEGLQLTAKHFLNYK